MSLLKNIFSLFRINDSFLSSNRLKDEYSIRSRSRKIVLIVSIFLSFLVIATSHVNKHVNPEGWDTTAYLGEANLIKNNGGIKNFIRLCITGKYKQANQHPLYILLISPFASKEISFFINAKITSVIIGLIMLFMMYLLVTKKYGDLCSSIVLLGIALNATFLKWTSLVACESLLMLLSFICMLFTIEGFENNKKWIFAGIFAGLAFMAKGTGLFLIPGYIVSTFLIFKFKIFKKKFFYYYFLAFLVISSPLIIRNVIKYNNPFYNVNIAKFSYTKDQLNESAYQIFNPNVGTGVHIYSDIDVKIRNTTPFKDGKADPLRLIKDAAHKVFVEASVFLDALSLWPIKYVIPERARIIVGLFLLCFFVIGIRSEKKASRAYLISTILIFIICLTLFRPLRRYFLPIVPFVWIYIGIGFLITLDFFTKRSTKKSIGSFVLEYTPYIVVVIFLMSVGVITLDKSMSNPFKSVDYSGSRKDTLKWMRENLKKEDKYVDGPNFNWQLKHGTWVLPPKNYTKSIAGINKFAKKYSINYIIIDWYSLTVSRFRGGGIDRLKKYEGYFELDPQKGIIQKRHINNWELVYKDPRDKVESMIFRIL